MSGITGGAPDNWAHKDSYSRKGQDFMVEVTRHSVWQSPGYDSEGPHRWCVYAYIYPKHPHFSAFDGDSIYQGASSALHLHGGCSYLARPTYGSATCVKVGADYHHLHDDHFTHCATPHEAYEVFSDADELFEQLQSLATSIKEQA